MYNLLKLEKDVVKINKIDENIIKDFKIEGKNEDLKYYTDIFNVNDFINQSKFLILGYKGTGKTYFLKKIGEVKTESNFKIINCNMEKFYLILNKLDKKKINNIRKELDMIWRFMIFIEIFKIVKNEKMNGVNRKNINLINKFLSKNNFLLNLSSDKILNKIIDEEIQINTEINLLKNFLNIFQGDIKKSTQKTTIKAEYYEFLESFEEKISMILKELDYGISIFFDELDSKFENNKNNKDILLSLIEEINRLNFDYSNLDIYICLRTEIFGLLNSPDLNKIKEDKSIIFRWDRSNLIKMLKKRFNEELSDAEFIRKYFESENRRLKKGKHKKKNVMNIFTFILHRTRYRPRDVVAFFKYILERDSSIPITNEIIDTEWGYSNYLYHEVENELAGFYKQEFIKREFDLIKKFNRSTFTVEEFVKFNRLNNEKEYYLGFFQKLYDLDVINYIKTQNEHQKKVINNNNNGVHVLDYNHTIAINYGLRHILNLYDPVDKSENLL